RSRREDFRLRQVRDAEDQQRVFHRTASGQQSVVAGGRAQELRSPFQPAEFRAAVRAEQLPGRRQGRYSAADWNQQRHLPAPAAALLNEDGSAVDSWSTIPVAQESAKIRPNCAMPVLAMPVPVACSGW